MKCKKNLNKYVHEKTEKKIPIYLFYETGSGHIATEQEHQMLI